MTEEKLILELDWDQAKAIQVAIGPGMRHWKEDSEPRKYLEALESRLEDFTGTSTLIFTIPQSSNQKVNENVCN